MSSLTIVAFRGAPQRDARRFICSIETWEFLRDLGQTFGWQPTGTTYVTSSLKRTPLPIPIRHNYQAGGEQDYKQIETEDAVQWAGALEVAKQSPHFDGMMRAQAGLVGSPVEPLLNVLEEFIDFARKGAFVFALSDTEVAAPVIFAPASISAT